MKLVTQIVFVHCHNMDEDEINLNFLSLILLKLFVLWICSESLLICKGATKKEIKLRKKRKEKKSKWHMSTCNGEDDNQKLYQ